MNSNLFRVVSDTSVTPPVYRIIQFSQVDQTFAVPNSQLTIIDGMEYTSRWIRSSEGTVANFDSEESARRTIDDLCYIIDFDQYTQIGEDVSTTHTRLGFIKNK